MIPSSVSSTSTNRQPLLTSLISNLELFGLECTVYCVNRRRRRRQSVQSMMLSCNMRKKSRSLLGAFLLVLFVVSSLDTTILLVVDSFAIVSNFKNLHYQNAVVVGGGRPRVRKRTPTTPDGTASVPSTSSTTSLWMVFDLDPDERMTTQDLIDQILDESLRTSARRPIMKQFDPDSKNLYRHWTGTVLSESWKSAFKSGIWAAMVYFLFKKFDHVGVYFEGLGRVWTEILAITTFTLTFFVNEAYTCWKACLNICYEMQGRMNDLGLALAGSAQRREVDPTTEKTVSNNRYTPESLKILLILARYLRLFNLFSYASYTKSHRPVITKQGLRRMVSRGMLTSKERDILINSKVSSSSRHNEVMMWLLRTAFEAIEAGHLIGGAGLEQNLLLRIQEIRSQGNYMECVLRGRMPFAYIHIVQVLVGSVKYAYPIMAFRYGLSFPMGVLGAMALTITYQGLFDLAKRFLDPFHNENFWKGDADPIMVNTLIAETNAGSLRWIEGLMDSPIPSKALTNPTETNTTVGEESLDDFVLPDEGYTAEEANAREAAKLARETADLSETASKARVLAKDSSVLKPKKEREREVEQKDKEEELARIAYEEEYEETKLILNTPPGYEFVPGIDDSGESLCFLNYDAVLNGTISGTVVPVEGDIENETKLTKTQDYLEVICNTPVNKYVEPTKIYEQFKETAEEEYEAFGSAASSSEAE